MSSMMKDFVSTSLPERFRVTSRRNLLNMRQRSGKYYKPWKPSNPIVIVSTKKQIAELSEGACFSQRAVYADVTQSPFFEVFVP